MGAAQFCRRGVYNHLMPRLSVTYFHQANVWQVFGAWVVYLHGNHVVFMVCDIHGMLEAIVLLSIVLDVEVA